jgi:outer membrane lipoprotein carrier protein
MMKKPVSGVSCLVPAKKPFLNHTISLIWTLFMIIILCTPAAASEVDIIVDRVQKTFAGIKDMKGAFSQTSYIKDIEETQMYSGTFFVKKPSLMMWEYAKPRDEKVTIQGVDTWIYKKSQNQVIKTTFSKETYSQVPIALLSSFENIRKDFHISLTGKNALQLVPKHRIGFLKTLVMETVPEGFPVKMFTIIDTYGNIIMIELNRMEINPGLDDSLFEFRVPEGAEVFDLNQ